MATKPTEPIIIIAEDDVNLPSTGQPNKELPNSAVLTTGYDDNQVVTAENLNYTFNNHGQWLKFLDESVDTLESRVITAGDGLTGGGDLAEDRTFNLGIPSELDGSTTNNVTTTSHTHALSIASVAEAQLGADNIKLMTPLSTRETFSPSAVTALTESITLPNGKILKEGTTPSITANNTYSVSFETAFPNQCTNIQLSISRDSIVSGTLSPYFTSKSTTGFTVIIDPSKDAEAETVTVDWTATGY